jgi:hypothetical protein
MIEARRLSKRYGDTLAVDSLSFTVEPGSITLSAVWTPSTWATWRSSTTSCFTS